MSDHSVATDERAQTQEEMEQHSVRKMNSFLELFGSDFVVVVVVCFPALVLDRITLYSFVVASEDILPCPENLTLKI